MYYRKYFSGTVDAGTATAIKWKIKGGGVTTTNVSSSSSPTRCNVIGEAIASTLRDCGLDAQYDETYSYVYFDKKNTEFGLYVAYESSYVYLYPGWCATERTDNAILTRSNGAYYSRQSNSSAYVPFITASYLAASDYKFYVTVRGDTEGMFTLYIGSYSTPTAMTTSVLMGTFYRGTDKRNNRKLWGFYMSNQPTTGIYWIYADTLLPVVGASSSTPYEPSAATPVTRLYMINEWVVLTEMYMQYGFIVMDNTYIDPGFNTSGTFYEVDGEMYFCYTPFFVKCITPVETQ